jgi:hypothetical protein
MKWSFWHSAGLFLLLGLIVGTGFLLPSKSAVGTWIIISLALIVSVLLIGHGLTGFWKGALIDEDNRVSLSRFQMTCWTVIVLSAFLTAAFVNIKYCRNDPLAIKVPEGLWILLGISTTSLVGSPLLKSVKKDKAFPSQDFLKTNTFSAYQAKGIDEQRIGHVGLIFVNKLAKDASFADVFRGEEVSNAANLDLSKIQMFYFTLITIVAYVVAVAAVFSHGPDCIAGLPPLSESMVALLAISHAGYLTSKAVPRPVGNKVV